MKRPIYLLVFGISPVMMLSLHGCGALFFTDAATPDRPAPLTHAAEHLWVDCLAKNRAAVIASKSDRPGIELETEVQKSCSAEAANIVTVATSENGRDYADDLKKRELSRPYTGRLITTARARLAGADTIVSPLNMSIVKLSRDEFDDRMVAWDACMSSAAYYFAIGNRRDPPAELAEFAENFCANLQNTLSSSYVTPPMGDRNTVSKFVVKHAHDRLQLLAMEIASAQLKPSRPETNERVPPTD